MPFGDLAFRVNQSVQSLPLGMMPRAAAEARELGGQFALPGSGTRP